VNRRGWFGVNLFGRTVMNPLPSPPAPPAPSRDRFKFGGDVRLLLVFLATCAPSITGLPAHEWVSFAIVPMIALHLALNWAWIIDVTRRALGRLSGEVRFNHFLDGLLFLSFALLMVSGILVSEAALPALGFTRKADPFWTNLHNTTANTFPSLIGIHLAMHWRWIAGKLRGRNAAVARPGGTP
jgi:hypothetical protein